MSDRKSTIDQGSRMGHVFSIQYIELERCKSDNPGSGMDQELRQAIKYKSETYLDRA